MQAQISGRDAALAAVVLLHLGISMVHGFAHARAEVNLSQASMLFVFAVILFGPVAGLIAQRLAWPRGGAWVVAVTMTAALAFGVVNHFLIPGVDHVAHVAGPWRILFGVTAALLAVTESLGSVLAVWCATRVRRAA